MIELNVFLSELTDAGIELSIVRGKLKARTFHSEVDPKLLAKIKQYKDDIIVFLTYEQQKNQIPVILPLPSNECLTLSFAQQRLWMLDKIDGGSSHYNMPMSLRLDGELNTEAVVQALETIVSRHESLRTCFIEGADGDVQQHVQPASAFALAYHDLSDLSEQAQSQAVETALAEEAEQSFDLSGDLMLRARLLRLSTNAHVLLVTLHHIASDGWSMSILINEFSALYQAYSEGKESPLAPLPIQYGDYAHWQRNWLQGEVLSSQLGFWSEQLKDLPVVHHLPLDRSRPSEQSFVGADYFTEVSGEVHQGLQQLCQGQGATLFMGLHAAFSVLLSRYSNERDIVVGSPVANREQAEVSNLIGFFVNTLVLRSDLSGSPSFMSLLGQSKGMLLDAYAHQQVPFEQIVEHIQPERSLQHSPLFQVMLVLQNNESGELNLPGLSLSPVGAVGAVAKYELTLTVTETDEGLGLGWEYNTALFEESTIARMASSFNHLLTALVAAPDADVFALPMLAKAEQQALLSWNDTAADYPSESTIHALFEQQVARTPDAVALEYNGEQLSYGELNARANQLAHYLINERGVTPDTLVGLCVARSFEMVIGILGILKAGGAYVPLDPDYPEERLAYMLADAKLETVLTQEALAEQLPLTQGQCISLDSEVMLATLAAHATDNSAVADLNASHLAYVIYTSGSTGQPKGVMLAHSSVNNYLSFATEQYVHSV